MFLRQNGLILIAAAMLILSVGAWRSARVEFSYYVLAADSANTNTTYEPVRFGDDVPAAAISIVMSVGPVFPDRFEVKADDCLTELQVNGRQFNLDRPKCSYPHSLTFDLGALLKPGRNVLRATVTNDGGHGGFVISPSREDPLLLGRAAYVVLAAVFLLLAVLRRFSAFKSDHTVWLICGLGLALRTGYYLLTPYWSRGYDLFGHLEYIDFIRNHWSLPPAANGWMFYQPPLYYGVCAAAASLIDMLLPGTFSTAEVAQLLGFLCSIWFVLALASLLSALFVSTIQRRTALLLGVCWPGLVLFASRINNDVLLAPLMLAAISLLLRWWRRPDKRFLLQMSMVLGLLLLTKSNALVIAVLAVVCVALRDRRRLLENLLCILLPAMIAAGAYYSFRLAADDPLMLGGNTNLDQWLKVDTTPQSLAAFSPSELILQPFNDPREPGFRRDVFLEYWLKSSLFAEFDFGEQTLSWARAALGLTICIFLLAALGLALSRRKHDEDDLLMLLMFAAGVSAHLMYRLFVPYSSAQDFRYTWFVLIPVWFFFARTLEHEFRAVRLTSLSAAVLFAGFAGLFVFSALFAPLPMWR